MYRGSHGDGHQWTSPVSLSFARNDIYDCITGTDYDIADMTSATTTRGQVTMVMQTSTYIRTSLTTASVPKHSPPFLLKKSRLTAYQLQLHKCTAQAYSIRNRKPMHMSSASRRQIAKNRTKGHLHLALSLAAECGIRQAS
jgi:hypothetical protein